VRPLAGGATELVPMRWGLVPSWWKKPLKQVPATFNARAELSPSRRCSATPSSAIAASCGVWLLRVAEKPDSKQAVMTVILTFDDEDGKTRYTDRRATPRASRIGAQKTRKPMKRWASTRLGQCADQLAALAKTI